MDGGSVPSPGSLPVCHQKERDNRSRGSAGRDHQDAEDKEVEHARAGVGLAVEPLEMFVVEPAGSEEADDLV